MNSTQTYAKNEDLIVDIYGKVTELGSYSNILYYALSNEHEKIEQNDIKNTVYILCEALINVRNDIEKYINYCEDTGIFNKSDNDILKA